MEKSGFSKKAIEYYVKKVNFGGIKSPDAFFVFTGPCGDTVEIGLKIKDNIVTDAKFRTVC